jgi:hypothetical protein
MATTLARSPRRFPALLLVLVAAFGIPASGAAPATVNLPAAAPAQRAVDLQEVWRLGGEDDEDVLLGLISAAALGPDGNAYLVDRQLSQVLVVGPDGGLVKTLGRQGEGPGELRGPHGLFLLPDGRVAVIQGFLSRVTTLRPDGTPGGEIRVGGEPAQGGFNTMRDLRLCGDRLVGVRGRGVFNQESGKSTQVTTMTIMDLSGNDLVKLCERTIENDMAHRVFDEAAEFSELNTWTTSRDGSIFTAPERDAWAVNVRGLDGGLARTLRRPFTPRKRTAAEKAALTDGMIVIVNGRRQQVESKALDRAPAILRLNAAADGRLFVTSCLQDRDQLPDGAVARYDVVTPDGGFIEELTLRAPGFDRNQDVVLFLDGRTFLVVSNFDQAREAMAAGLGGGHGGDAQEPAGEVEPLEVICYRMPQ